LLFFQDNNLRSGQTNILKMKSVPVVSNLTSTGVVGYNSNSYTIMFPALPALKTLGNIGIKRQSAVFEKRSIVRTSTINEVIHHAILIIINKYQYDQHGCMSLLL
jgi:hypothetical protein